MKSDSHIFRADQNMAMRLPGSQVEELINGHARFDHGRSLRLGWSWQGSRCGLVRERDGKAGGYRNHGRREVIPSRITENKTVVQAAKWAADGDFCHTAELFSERAEKFVFQKNLKIRKKRLVIPRKIIILSLPYQRLWVQYNRFLSGAPPEKRPISCEGVVNFSWSPGEQTTSRKHADHQSARP
ncbi:hypothetical protein ICN84_00440 [Akkermansia glycaniphila]|uniref:hypothetical protein n=1 Tax=Akkermansia glycaniphila TaxID=1679444 RepID=UPI001C00D8B7|nr:hypothetical protein [Akkermansia glycaniphila]MBT9448538.1 hypothetical protein [Akkermansia glycaniphila]